MEKDSAHSKYAPARLGGWAGMLEAGILDSVVQEKLMTIEAIGWNVGQE